MFACGAERARILTVADLASAEPIYLEVEREPLEVPEEPPTPVLRHRESDAVMLVSWVYLAASLVLAIPTVGFLVGGLAGARPLHLLQALACGAGALALKHLGDLIAIGDRRGRTAHLYTCLGAAVFSVSPAASFTLALLSAPFWTRRGRQHFSRRSR